MEEIIPLGEDCCFGCLVRNDDVSLLKYTIQNEALKTIFQTESISLCYICKRMAQHTESFIQTVQSNQILMENCPDMCDPTFESIKNQTQPLISLKHLPLDIIELTGSTTDDVVPFFVTYNSKKCEDFKIKLELKDEDAMPDHLEGEFIDDDVFQDPYIKEEDNYPLKALLKCEPESDEDVDLETLKMRKKYKTKKKDKDKRNTDHKSADIPQIKHFFLTREQCMEERAKMLEDKKYTNCLHKCEDCIKGYNFKASYEKHMEKHSERSGDFECDICKQRWLTEKQLLRHKKYHYIRYKCKECGFVCICRSTAKYHYTSFHGHDYYQYKCPQCPKIFNRQVTLRKHICYAHRKKERIKCIHCFKSYATKEGLKEHMLMKHIKDEATDQLSKRHICSECGMGFKAPSQLRNHSIKHSGTRDYYCVECDKSFKTDAVLKQHLKTAAPHVNYIELPLPCLHCDKRFAIKRDLERHTNRIHLNIRPFQCDRCDKAYVNAWSLTEHKRLVHEGFKRPLKYPCTMCDKVFDRNQILKSHIRTHTGERPYQCSICPAQFTQANVLRTHIKLIHLKLTRDGRPKTVALK